MARSLGREKITEGTIWRPLLSFFFPILLGTFFQQLYNTVDAIVVGQYVGKHALAAVGGTTGTLINLLVGFFVAFSSTATIIISQSYGGNRHEDTAKEVHTAVALTFVGGCILTVLGLLLSSVALKAIGTPEDVFGYARTYMLIYFSGIVFTMLYNIGAGILRAVGDSRSPLVILIIASIIHLLLDLFFVIELQMGVTGVAVSTVLSQIISAFLVIFKLMRTTDCYQLKIGHIRIDFNILKQIMRIGLPNGLQSIMYSISNIIVQASINSFGTDILAAWTAYGKIDGIFWLIISAFGISVTTFSGQNFGAGKIDRIRKSVRISLLLSIAIAVTLSLVLYAWGNQVYSLFTSDETVIMYGLQILKTLVPFYFTYTFVEVLSGAIRGTGDTLTPTIITSLGICGVRVIWVYLIVPHWYDIRMVALSYPVAWILTAVLFIIYYLRGEWEHGGTKRHADKQKRLSTDKIRSVQ